MPSVSVEIERITEKNYPLFDDMIHWRMSGQERSAEEKSQNEKREFIKQSNELKRQGFWVYAARHQGRYVGWIACLYIPKVGVWEQGVVFVDELWVAPSFRDSAWVDTFWPKRLICKMSTRRERFDCIRGLTMQQHKGCFRNRDFSFPGKLAICVHQRNEPRFSVHFFDGIIINQCKSDCIQGSTILQPVTPLDWVSCSALPTTGGRFLLSIFKMTGFLPVWQSLLPMQ